MVPSSASATYVTSTKTHAAKAHDVAKTRSAKAHANEATSQTFADQGS
jgi:hypothetical protein